MKKQDFAAFFTLRADGRYQGYWHELDRTGKPKGKRHFIYDRDPERLFYRIQEKETPKKVTMSDILDKWEEQHRDSVAVRTWANYAPHVQSIKDIYGDSPVAELTAADVNQDLLAAKAKGLSYTVVNSRRCIWRMAFDFAVGERVIQYNPALSVKNPKGLPKGTRKAPEEDIIDKIVAGANDMDFGFIPFFFLCTGVRRSEGLQRLKSDVNTKTWELTIPKAKTEAGIRTVPIITPLREPLKKWMEAHPGKWLFPYIPYNGHKGTYMSDRNWETAWTAYCEKHGWVDEEGKPTIGAHNLRHGTATLLYEAGVDVYTAQHILGHDNVTTTLQIYTDLRDKYKKKNITKFARSMTKKKAASEKKTEGN